MLTLDSTPAASAPPASASIGTSATGRRNLKARSDEDAFDHLLSQLTDRASDASEEKPANAGAPADRSGQSATVATDAPVRGASRGAGVQARLKGAADAEAQAAHATGNADDDQAVANALMWLLGCADPAQVPSAPTAAGGTGTNPDGAAAASGSEQTVDGGSVGSATATPNGVAAGVRANAGAAQGAAVDSALDAVDDEGPQQAAGAPDRARLAAVAAEARALPEGSSAKPADAKPPVNAPRNEEAAPNAGDTAAAPSPETTGAVIAKAAAAAWFEGGVRSTAANAGSPDAPAASPNGATEKEPGAKAAVPAVPTVAGTAAAAPMMDARGSTRKEGRGLEQGHAEPAWPRPAASTAANASVFQAPIEIRTVGGVSTAASVAEVATSSNVPGGMETDLPRQIVQAVRLQWTAGVGDAQITLQPEYLGELSISIRVEHGVVTAALQSSVPAVREWIDSHQPMLRQALAAQGLELDRLTTSEPQATPDRHREQQQPERREPNDEPKQQRRRTRSDAPAFELIA